MISRDALEKVIKEDLAGIWNVLTPEDKRVVVENFTTITSGIRLFMQKKKRRNIFGAF